VPKVLGTVAIRGSGSATYAGERACKQTWRQTRWVVATQQKTIRVSSRAQQGKEIFWGGQFSTTAGFAVFSVPLRIAFSGLQKHDQFIVSYAYFAKVFRLVKNSL
jgi:hypothetical protein